MAGGSLLLLALMAAVAQVTWALLEPSEFAPIVSASCKTGWMEISVTTKGSFTGAVQAMDSRTPACVSFGNGTNTTTLRINMLAGQGEKDYCGVLANNRTEEYSIPIAVRVHRNLELSDDKLYIITCGKGGFRNTNNQTSLVSLTLMHNGRKVPEPIYGHPYTLRAEISKYDGLHGFRVRKCFAFNKLNGTVNLINDKGCPVNGKVITPFEYSEGRAEATIQSMFRFSEDSQIHFQCDVVVCKGTCPDLKCDPDTNPVVSGSNPAWDGTGTLLATTGAFVLQPGQEPGVQELCESVAGVHPPWLLYLCIALGVLLLVMVCVNLCLCTAMSCACHRVETLEKEPSVLEEYDPYRSWHADHYGSRYSLNGKPGYTSGGSTMNSTRSMSTNSDHYAIVHSRPESRYSGHHRHHGNSGTLHRDNHGYQK